jgi:peptide/nickel transport system permease protein
MDQLTDETEVPVTEQRADRGRFVKVLLSTHEGRIGLILVVFIALVVVLGPHFAPYSPTAIGVGPPATGPSAHHLLGTDEYGRDVLSRLLYGGASVFVVPLVSVLLAFSLGLVIGVTLGFTGGNTDVIGCRILDLFIAIPPYLIVLSLIAGLGTSSAVLVASLAGVYFPRIARVLRGATQSVVTRDYVEAARARGDPVWSVMTFEILPNIMEPALVEAALRLTYAIIFIAGLSFIGLGAQPPSSNWALMVNESRAILYQNPWAIVSSAAMIGLLALGVGLLADVWNTHLGRELRPVE